MANGYVEKNPYVGSCTTIGNRSKIIGGDGGVGGHFWFRVEQDAERQSEVRERGWIVLIVHRRQLPRQPFLFLDYLDTLISTPFFSLFHTFQLAPSAFLHRKHLQLTFAEKKKKKEARRPLCCKMCVRCLTYPNFANLLSTIRGAMLGSLKKIIKKKTCNYTNISRFTAHIFFLIFLLFFGSWRISSVSVSPFWTKIDAVSLPKWCASEYLIMMLQMMSWNLWRNHSLNRYQRASASTCDRFCGRRSLCHR